MHSLPVGGEVAAAVGVANSMPAMVVAGCTCSAVAGVAVVAGVAAAGFSPLVTAITVVAVEMVVGTAACGCSESLAPPGQLRSPAWSPAPRPRPSTWSVHFKSIIHQWFNHKKTCNV